jgi:hypothetical protein
MFEDEPGQFGVALVTNDHPCICVWRDVRAAATYCAESPEPGVGGSARDITSWLQHRKGVVTSTPIAVTVGGLHGYMIDLHMSPSWKGTCPFSGGTATVPILVGSGIGAGVFWGSDADSSQREYILDLSSNSAHGNIAINVQICCGVTARERLAAATPIIESFAFKTT